MKPSIIATLLAMPQILASSREADKFDMEDTNYGNIKNTAAEFQAKAGITGAKDLEDDIYYFFTLHDYNRDHFLDGHELGLAYLGYEFFEEAKGDDKGLFSIELPELEKMIEHTLKEDDKDNDGRISWQEYLESQAYFKYIVYSMMSISE
jgi:hypothetical protein